MTLFDLVAGREPAAAGEVVIDDASVRRLGVEVGETVVVAASGRLMDVVVVGIAAPSAGSLEQQSALFFTDDDVAAALRASRLGRRHRRHGGEWRRYSSDRRAGSNRLSERVWRYAPVAAAGRRSSSTASSPTFA